MIYQITLIKKNPANNDNTKIVANNEYIQKEITEHEYNYIINFLERNEDIIMKDPLGE
jgi:hypothetical protein